MLPFSSALSPSEFNQVAGHTEVWLPLIMRIAHETRSSGSLTRFSDGSNIVFASGDDRVIKVFPKFMEFQYEAEKAALGMVYGHVSTATPLLLYFGHCEGWPYLVMSRVNGTPLSVSWPVLSKEQQCSLLYELGKLVFAHHELTVEKDFPAPAWSDFIPNQISKCVERHTRLRLPANLLGEIPEYLKSIDSFLPIQLNHPVLLTGEFTPGNILTSWSNGTLKISGLIDYGDSMIGFHEYDFLGPCTFLAAGEKDLLLAFFRGYGYSSKDIDRSLIRRLMALLLLHRYSNLDVQINLPNWRNVDSLASLEALIWPLFS